MRALLSLLLICSLLVCGQTALAVADEEGPVMLPDGTGDGITDGTAMEGEGSVYLQEAQAALLVEASGMQPLMALNADAARPVAGLARLPAVLVLAEAVDHGEMKLTDEITVSRRAAGMGGPSAFIEAEERIAAEPLMKAAVMICAGDAILALGEHVFGTENAFMERVNARMLELNVSSAYTDGVGTGVELSPNSLAILGAALMRSDCFVAHSKLTYEHFTHADGRETELVNANRMLRDVAGCAGVATGSSPADGYGGVFSVTRGDTHLIAVVLGAKNSSARFSAARGMLEETFAKKRAQKLAEAGEVLAEDVRVQGGKSRTVNLVAKDTVVLLLERADPALVPVKDVPESLNAPLGTGDVVGSITYQTPEGVVMGKVELVPQSAVDQSLLRECISSVILTFLRL